MITFDAMQFDFVVARFWILTLLSSLAAVL